MCSARRRSAVCSAVGLMCALGALCSGLFCILGFPDLFQAVLRDQLTLRPGSAAYSAWRKPSMPTKIRFFLFSVENPDEVGAGEKPRLAEHGPYVYREEKERVDQVFGEDGTVSYRTRTFWYPVAAESAPLEAELTVLDVPQFAAAESARGSPLSAMAISSSLYFRPSLFVRRTARELLFQGYSDPLLTAGAFFNPDSKIPMDKFGWFYARNGTTWADDVIKMATGTADYNELGEIKEWKHSNRTIYPEECGQLTGSATGFIPVVPDRQYIDYFSPDICRPIRFRRAESWSHHGLPVTKFAVHPMETFGNASTNPATHCYNANHPAGVHNATGCKDAGILPVFVSLPHFLGADPTYLDQFQAGSFNQSEDDHASFMVFQLNTSIPVQIKMRLQIMLQVRPNLDIGDKFSNLRETYLPMLWFDAVAETTPELEHTIWFLVFTPTIVWYVGVVLICLSTVLLSVCVLLVLRKRANSRNNISSEEISSKEELEHL